MRIHIIGNEVRELADVRNYSGLWSFSLAQRLRAVGVDVRFVDDLSADSIADAQHVLAIKWRATELLTPQAANAIKRSIGGALVQLYDTPQKKLLNVDCAFTIRSDPVPDGRRWQNHAIGWAADPSLLRPNQGRRLRILIDHRYYGAKSLQTDRSYRLSHDVAQFVSDPSRWKKHFEAVEIRIFGNCAIEDWRPGVVPDYKRNAIPYPVCLDEYRRTHLFMVTHSESVGQTALEVAMAGGLPVYPTGYLPHCLVKDLRAVRYDFNVPWETVLSQIDVEKSREWALPFTWERVAKNVIDWFANFRRET